MRLRYPYALVLSAALVLLVHKLVTIVHLAPLTVLLGWLLEVAALSALAALWGASQRVRGLALVGSVSFAVLAHAVIVPSLSHTYFFESAAERRFSLLNVDLRTLRYFFANVLPVRGVLLLLGLLASMHLGAYLLSRRTFPKPLPLSITGLVALALFVGLLRVNPPLPSPIADLAGDLGERLFAPRLAVDRSRPARFSPRAIDRSGVPAHGAARYDKVLVFVMETMNSDLMERETKLLPADTFVHNALPHAHRYEQYYATNQDSRTGMLAMLTSRLIPYEAYTEVDRDHYMFLGERPSLVDAMKHEGFRTAFAVSQEEVEIVVGDMPWDDVIHIEEGEIDAGRMKDKLCFVPYEFEHACEDLALLPRVLAFLDQNPRAFLYQEFIWGHDAEYNQASGRTNTDYYSRYLDAVLAHLAETGALERTLFVLTSDHGIREKDDQRRRETYRLPLWFYA
ncbi:MAG TPA: sulfatase-like hydrolase/transferase, partial [Polyangiales bacterium]|nr:sulfatase-like hydrolase/transferase [Polyangiales bacterium]